MNENDYTEAPEGWMPFGTHAGQVTEDDDGGMAITMPPQLVFSYEIDETGMPRWERPGDLRQEIGDLVAGWREQNDDHIADCIADMERLFGIQS